MLLRICRISQLTQTFDIRHLSVRPNLRPSPLFSSLRPLAITISQLAHTFGLRYLSAHPNLRPSPFFSSLRPLAITISQLAHTFGLRYLSAHPNLRPSPFFSSLTHSAIIISQLAQTFGLRYLSARLDLRPSPSLSPLRPSAFVNEMNFWKGVSGSFSFNFINILYIDWAMLALTFMVEEYPIFYNVRTKKIQLGWHIPAWNHFNICLFVNSFINRQWTDNGRQ